MKTRNFVKSTAILLILILFLTTCQKEIPKKTYTGKALGTTYHIHIQGRGKPLSQKEIEKLISRLNKSLSTYISTSLISKINHGDTLFADIHFRRVFDKAYTIYKQTEGIYDPTIGILVNAWGFGPGKKLKNIERDSALVDSLLQYVGMNMVEIDKQGMVRKKYPQIFLDFNSIAKGYIIDQIGDLINKKGYQNYLIELGGEVLAQGKNIVENRPWIVAVDYPVIGNKTYIMGVELHNEAIATSGNYRKFRIDKTTGKKYVHTLNPKTGFPQASDLLSASIIAPDCTTADAWATACMAAGTKRAIRFITSHPSLKAILIYSDKNGKLQIWTSPGIKTIQME